MAAIDYGRVEVLTFDCYGTLIDWEAGIAAGLGAVTRAHGVDVPDEELLTTYARHEAALEAGPYLRYREVLGRGCRGVCADLGISPTDAEVDGVRRVGRGVAGLPGLGCRPGRARRAVPAGRDHELRRRPVRRLEPAARRDVRLDRHGPAGGELQAQPSQLRAGVRADRRAARSGSSTSRRASTTTTCRRRSSACSRSGSTAGPAARGAGATPPAAAAPDATFPDMASFAESALRA